MLCEAVWALGTRLRRMTRCRIRAGGALCWKPAAPVRHLARVRKPAQLQVCPFGPSVAEDFKPWTVLGSDNRQSPLCCARDVPLLTVQAGLHSVWKNNPNATSIIEPLRDSAPNPGESGYEGSNATVRPPLSSSASSSAAVPLGMTSCSCPTWAHHAVQLLLQATCIKRTVSRQHLITVSRCDAGIAAARKGERTRPQAAEGVCRCSRHGISNARRPNPRSSHCSIAREARRPPQLPRHQGKRSSAPPGRDHVRLSGHVMVGSVCAWGSSSFMHTGDSVSVWA